MVWVAYDEEGRPIGTIEDSNPNVHITVDAWRKAGYKVYHRNPGESLEMKPWEKNPEDYVVFNATIKETPSGGFTVSGISASDVKRLEEKYGNDIRIVKEGGKYYVVKPESKTSPGTSAFGHSISPPKEQAEYVTKAGNRYVHGTPDYVLDWKKFKLESWRAKKDSASNISASTEYITQTGDFKYVHGVPDAVLDWDKLKLKVWREKKDLQNRLAEEEAREQAMENAIIAQTGRYAYLKGSEEKAQETVSTVQVRDLSFSPQALDLAKPNEYTLPEKSTTISPEAHTDVEERLQSPAWKKFEFLDKPRQWVAQKFGRAEEKLVEKMEQSTGVKRYLFGIGASALAFGKGVGEAITGIISPRAWAETAITLGRPLTLIETFEENPLAVPEFAGAVVGAWGLGKGIKIERTGEATYRVKSMEKVRSLDDVVAENIKVFSDVDRETVLGTVHETGTMRLTLERSSLPQIPKYYKLNVKGDITFSPKGKVVSRVVETTRTSVQGKTGAIGALQTRAVEIAHATPIREIVRTDVLKLEIPKDLKVDLSAENPVIEVPYKEIKVGYIKRVKSVGEVTLPETQYKYEIVKTPEGKLRAIEQPQVGEMLVEGTEREMTIVRSKKPLIKQRIASIPAKIEGTKDMLSGQRVLNISEREYHAYDISSKPVWTVEETPEFLKDWVRIPDWFFETGEKWTVVKARVRKSRIPFSKSKIETKVTETMEAPPMPEEGVKVPVEVRETTWDELLGHRGREVSSEAPSPQYLPTTREGAKIATKPKTGLELVQRTKSELVQELSPKITEITLPVKYYTSLRLPALPVFEANINAEVPLSLAGGDTLKFLNQAGNEVVKTVSVDTGTVGGIGRDLDIDVGIGTKVETSKITGVSLETQFRTGTSTRINTKTGTEAGIRSRLRTDTIVKLDLSMPTDLTFNVRDELLGRTRLRFETKSKNSATTGTLPRTGSGTRTGTATRTEQVLQSPTPPLLPPDLELNLKFRPRITPHKKVVKRKRNTLWGVKEEEFEVPEIWW